MENLFVIIASVAAGVPLYVYGRCRQFFDRTKVVGMVVAAVFLSAAAAGAYAAGETAEGHLALAKGYRLKAIAYERESEPHRLICEEYQFKTDVPRSQREAGPSLMQAQKNCGRDMRDTASLVEEARELAEYHTARAKALGAH